jgi:methylmalonyl-CoA mutase N-terminal domain/subunit
MSDGFRSQSNFPIKPVYQASDLADFDAETELALPGQPPFTRGIHPDMYLGKNWTMRQYAGFGDADQSNQRYRELIAQGTTGLSVAFDLPTQMGYDSDHPLAKGEVGRVGVAIDTIEDMRRLFAGIKLDEVTTSMTINSPAAILLVMYKLVAQEQGADLSKLSGTVQNDILKEYIARGTYIFPPQPSMRLTTDLFSYCAKELPAWNTISVSGYHMAEAGANPVQEIAFTLANAVAYVKAAIKAGLEVDQFAPRLSFFFVVRSTLLEEVAKFRAARRVWYKIMKSQFNAKSDKSTALKFHTQTAGVQLTAQQPEVNLVRVTIQALAAVLGGTQSLHTNSYDEALGLPTAKAAMLALRTQQVIANETDLTRTVDPFAGSYAIEAMTNQIEAEVVQLLARIENIGGAVSAIEQGLQKRLIEESAYQVAREIDAQERIIVGVNRYLSEEPETFQPHRIDPEVEKKRVLALKFAREKRDAAAVDKALAQVAQAAQAGDNLLYPIEEAVKSLATVGEICQVLRSVWGEFVPAESM